MHARTHSLDCPNNVKRTWPWTCPELWLFTPIWMQNLKRPHGGDESIGRAKRSQLLFHDTIPAISIHFWKGEWVKTQPEVTSNSPSIVSTVVLRVLMAERRRGRASLLAAFHDSQKRHLCHCHHVDSTELTEDEGSRFRIKMQRLRIRFSYWFSSRIPSRMLTRLSSPNT